MGRVNLLKNNFTAGEISPRIATRYGLQAYENGCLSIENMLVRKEGGLVKRPGLRFVAATKYADRRCRLIQFRFSLTQAYVIEAGHGYFRFFAGGGQIQSGGAPYEVTSPYAEDDLAALTWTQSGDLLYLLHPSHPPRSLARIGQTNWVLSGVPFSPPMTYEAGHRPAVGIVLSATTGTVSATLTAPQGFLASDADRLIEAQGGQATITAVTDAAHATLLVNRPFPTTAFNAGSWALVGSPNTALTPDKKEPIGAVVTLTLAANGWRFEDAGKFVDVAGGFVEITSITDAIHAKGIIREALSSTDEVGGGGWKIRSASWTVERGFPACAGFHQQRLGFGGVPADPGRLCLSRSADFYAFILGTEDDNAVEYPLLDDDAHTIRWIKSFGDALAVGTDSGAWVVKSGITDPTITPTAVAASMQAPSGSAAGAMARRVGAALIYVHRSRKSLRALQYNYSSDSYVVQDLNVLSEHLFRSAISDWAFQEERTPTLWASRGDGQLAGCTWYPEHEVTGWHRHKTAGDIENMAVIPGDPDDELWVTVRRTIGGETVRFVERLDPVADDDAEVADCLHVDCGLSYSGDPATTISGIEHLEGEVVQVVADGMVLPGRLVSDGKITLTYPASKVHVGLGYEASFVPTMPDIGAPDGSTAGRRMRVQRAVLDGMNATQCWVGPDRDHLILLDNVTTRRLDQPADSWTGRARMIPDTAYDEEYRFMVLHKLPTPFRVRAVAVMLESSQG